MKDLIAEKSILSGLCKFGVEGLNEVSDLITHESFNDNKNQNLYIAITSVLEKQNNVDQPSIMSTAETMSLNLSGHKDFIENLFDFPVKIDSVRPFAEKLRKLYLINHARHVLSSAYEDLQHCTGEEDLDEIYSKLEVPIVDFSMKNDVEETTKLYDDILDYVDFLEENDPGMPGISTGYPIIDGLMGGGTRRRSITLWACRTGVGKTILSGMVARHNAKKGIPVLILDTEMSEEDQKCRSLAATARVSLTSIEQGNFNELELQKVKDAAKELKNYPIHYRSVAGKSFDEILSICRRWILKEVGVVNGMTNDCLIIYDYFKLMDSKQLDNVQEYQALGFQISKLHDFCVKYDVPVHSFVQTNREDDVSQSDRLQWLASSVAIISEKTEEELAEDGEEWGNLKFTSVKNRFGPGLQKPNKVLMNRIGKFATIEELCTTQQMKLQKAAENESTF
jgi:replicative DNA helicase